MGKHFKIKITGEADHFSGNPSGLRTFTSEADEWYRTVGKESLESWFAEKQVLAASFLENFTFDENVDGVDKEKDQVNFF